VRVRTLGAAVAKDPRTPDSAIERGCRHRNASRVVEDVTRADIARGRGGRAGEGKGFGGGGGGGGGVGSDGGLEEEERRYKSDRSESGERKVSEANPCLGTR
jgi:hypothetical protein